VAPDGRLLHFNMANDQTNYLELLPRLTEGQIKFLFRLSQGTERAGFAIGQTEAGIVSSLSEKQLIHPLMKLGNSQRWQLTTLNIEERGLLYELGKSLLIT